MSACWEFFTLERPSSTTAKCKICNKDMSRGGTFGKFSTSNLIRHLENRHKKEHAVYLEISKKKKETPELLQQNVEELFKGREKYDKDHPKGKALTERVMEMVVLDDQPFQVVGNIGLRQYITDCKETTDLKKGRPNNSTSVRHSGRILNLLFSILNIFFHFF